MSIIDYNRLYAYAYGKTFAVGANERDHEIRAWAKIFVSVCHDPENEENEDETINRYYEIVLKTSSLGKSNVKIFSADGDEYMSDDWHPMWSVSFDSFDELDDSAEPVADQLRDRLAEAWDSILGEELLNGETPADKKRKGFSFGYPSIGADGGEVKALVKDALRELASESMSMSIRNAADAAAESLRSLAASRRTDVDWIRDESEKALRDMKAKGEKLTINTIADKI